MKKIMFNDIYGLTQAVLDGRKTMMRRIVRKPKEVEINGHAYLNTEKLPYNVGDTVAIAQKYCELSWDKNFYDKLLGICKRLPQYELAGWDNKMFVSADLMPHHILITGIRVERLQNISDADCLREGIMQSYDAYFYKGYTQHFNSAREAFADLIGKICGRGTWPSNPYVFVYEFKLVD